MKLSSTLNIVAVKPVPAPWSKYSKSFGSTSVSIKA